MIKKIIFIIFLIACLISFNMVSAGEDINCTDLSLGSQNDLLESSLNDIEKIECEDDSNDKLAIVNPDDEISSKSDEEKLSGCGPSHPGEDGTPYANLIVEKVWDGNYSGNITYVEIQFLYKLYAGEYFPPGYHPCPPPISPLPIDPNQDDEIYLIPDKDGNLVPYKLIQTVNLTKENNWRHVFTNITYKSALQNEDEDGNIYWVLHDPNEYIVREIKVPVNVTVTLSEFVKYFTCPKDGGLKVFWNVINRIENKTNVTSPPGNNTTTSKNNDTNNTSNKTTPKHSHNVTENKTKTNITVKTNHKKEIPVKKAKSEKHATGNPLIALLACLVLIPILRRRN